MRHLSGSDLQRFLAGPSDQGEAAFAEEHLSLCAQCQAQLGALAADDDALALALAPDQAEAAWIAAQDLRPAVMRELTPWFMRPQGYLLLLPLAAAGGWMLHLATLLLTEAVALRGPVSLAIALIRSVLPALWDLLGFLAGGGLLASLWPALLLLTVAVLWRQFRRPGRDAHSDA